MSKTIEGVPDYITREQYVGIFEAIGLDPSVAIEVRMAADGVHAVVFALDERGHRVIGHTGYRQGDLLSSRGGERAQVGFAKHRIFIPVRGEPGDRRTTRVRDVDGWPS